MNPKEVVILKIVISSVKIFSKKNNFSNWIYLQYIFRPQFFTIFIFLVINNNHNKISLVADTTTKQATDYSATNDHTSDLHLSPQFNFASSQFKSLISNGIAQTTTKFPATSALTTSKSSSHQLISLANHSIKLTTVNHRLNTGLANKKISAVNSLSSLLTVNYPKPELARSTFSIDQQMTDGIGSTLCSSTTQKSLNRNLSTPILSTTKLSSSNSAPTALTLTNFSSQNTTNSGGFNSSAQKLGNNFITTLPSKNDSTTLMSRFDLLLIFLHFSLPNTWKTNLNLYFSIHIAYQIWKSPNHQDHIQPSKPTSQTPSMKLSRPALTKTIYNLSAHQPPNHRPHLSLPQRTAPILMIAWPCSMTVWRHCSGFRTLTFSSQQVQMARLPPMPTKKQAEQSPLPTTPGRPVRWRSKVNYVN